MKIELYYFDECPSYKKAAENLEEALRLEGLEQDIEMVAVASEADAQVKRLIGSPSIRIDGVDLEGPQADDQGYGYGCRIYSENGGSAGWPSVERVRSVLRSLQRNPLSRRVLSSGSRTEEVRHDQTQPHSDGEQTP